MNANPPLASDKGFAEVWIMAFISTPISMNPNPAMMRPHPMSAHPDGVVIRTRRLDFHNRRRLGSSFFIGDGRRFILDMNSRDGSMGINRASRQRHRGN